MLITIRATSKRRTCTPEDIVDISQWVEDIGGQLSRKHGQSGKLSGGPDVYANGDKVVVSGAFFTDIGSTDHPTRKWLKDWHLK